MGFVEYFGVSLFLLFLVVVVCSLLKNSHLNNTFDHTRLNMYIRSDLFQILTSILMVLMSII